MPDGFTRTFKYLTETANEAAVRVLIPALDAPDPRIQEGALAALLNRRNPAGGGSSPCIATMKPEWMNIIRQHQGRMTQTLRDALLGSDEQMCPTCAKR